MHCPYCEGTLSLTFKNGLAWCPVCGGYYICPGKILETEEDEERFLKWIDELIKKYES
jgi:uncharacterized Zn finger protein (UPF0148 family)